MASAILPFNLPKQAGRVSLTTVSTEHVAFARSLGADVVIDYKTQRFEDAASGVDLVFDLIDGETRDGPGPC